MTAQPRQPLGILAMERRCVNRAYRVVPRAGDGNSSNTNPTSEKKLVDGLITSCQHATTLSST